MKQILRRYSLMLLALLLVVPGVHAASHKRHKHRKSHHKVAKAPAKNQKDEQHLRSIAKLIDRDTQNLSRHTYIELMADQFHVPLSLVDELQQKGQGWGNISITLAMANALSLKDAVHYPSPSDALSQIQSTRDTAKSWTEVARRTGIPMHSIILATARSHKTMTTQANTTVALATTY